MIGDIQKLLHATPFQPFSIRTADGREYPVLTRDHAWIPPGIARVHVSDDDKQVVLLPGLLISGILVTDPVQ